MSGPHKHADSSAFSRRMEAPDPMKAEPTLNELDQYVPTTRESKRAARVCKEDCVIAQASPEVRRLLCLALIRSKRPSLVIILRQRISRDKDLLDFLELYFPGQASMMSHVSPLAPGAFKSIRLMEPDVVWARLAIGALSKRRIGALVFLDFHIDLAHVYRAIMGLYQNALGIQNLRSTLLLAFTDDLQVRSVEDLESVGKSFRTPLGQTCHLGTPFRPHAKTIEVAVLSVDIDLVSQVMKMTSSDDCDGQLVAIDSDMWERDVVARRHQAKEAAEAKPI